MSDTLTLVLDGKVTLELLFRATAHLQGLVSALETEVAAGAAIEWEVTQLQSSSAVMTVRGRSAAPEVVDLVIQAYEQVGEALVSRQPLPFARASKDATSLVGLINGNIEAIRFETERADFLVRENTSQIPFDVTFALRHYNPTVQLKVS